MERFQLHPEQKNVTKKRSEFETKKGRRGSP